MLFRSDLRHTQSWNSSELAFEITDVLLAPLDKSGAFAQLFATDGRFDLAQSEVETHHVDEVGGSLGGDHRFRMIADQLQPLREIVVIGRAHSAFAGVNVLVVVETECPDMPEGADRSALVHRERRLRAILDDLEAVFPRELHDRPHVAGVAVEMYRDHGLGPRRDGRCHGLGVERPSHRIDIDKDRRGTGVNHHVRRRAEGEIGEERLLVASLVVCTVLGLVIERTTYRPLRYAPKLAPLITGIGISLVIQYAAALIWGRQYMSLPDLIKPEKIVFGGAQITSTQGFIFVLDCAIMAALLWFVKTSRMGRAMRATEQNPEVAGLMGVDATRVFAFTFALGAGIGAIAGVMVMLYYGQAHYLMGAMLGLKAFTAAVLGGIGSIPGAMLGGILLGLIEALASGYIGDITGGIFGSNYRDVFAFLVLVLVLMFKPSGLMGVHSGDRA